MKNLDAFGIGMSLPCLLTECTNFMEDAQRWCLVTQVSSHFELQQTELLLAQE